MVNYTPTCLKDALKLYAKTDVIPYAGGTDLMLHGKDDTTFMFLHKISEMKNITEDAEYIRFGAACTFTEIINNSLTPKILKDALSEIAAPAIRNLGTMGGNIANGSPKADSALVLFTCCAKLRIASCDKERIIPIKEFYKSRKELDLASGELIVEILVPKTGLDNYYYKKVGARGALAISRVSFAGIMDIKDGRILNCSTSFGAVSDVVICREDIDALFIGKTIEEAKLVKDDYIKAFSEAIVPIRGRVSAEYRKSVCVNLLKDFLHTMGI